MTEKTKVSRKEIIPYVTNISTAVENLSECVKRMPDCTAKKAFLNSIRNLNAKIEKYGAVKDRFHLSEEEKILILERRKQAEITPVTEETNEIPTAGEDEIFPAEENENVKSRKSQKKKKLNQSQKLL